MENEPLIPKEENKKHKRPGFHEPNSHLKKKVHPQNLWVKMLPKRVFAQEKLPAVVAEGELVIHRFFHLAI